MKYTFLAILFFINYSSLLSQGKTDMYIERYADMAKIKYELRNKNLISK